MRSNQILDFLKKVGIPFVFFFIYSSLVYAKDQVISQEQNEACEEMKIYAIQYMENIFGERNPTLIDYYKYESPHSETEYEFELAFCKQKWGNSLNLSDKEYIKKMPADCKKWINDRAGNEKEHPSLYYQSIRKRFKNFPLKFQITKMMPFLKEGYGHGCVVEIDIPDEDVNMILRVFYSIIEPEALSVIIEGIEISKEKAIEIGNKEAARMGYDLNKMSMDFSKYDTPWNVYIPKDTKSNYFLAQQEKLKNKTYWAVHYYPNPEFPYHTGVDIYIFIDALTGEILSVIMGR